jgi:hypothetical protein
VKSIQQRKPTHTVVKVYGVISLLSRVGKMVEKAIATWIVSFRGEEEIFHEMTIWLLSWDRHSPKLLSYTLTSFFDGDMLAPETKHHFVVYSI